MNSRVEATILGMDVNQESYVLVCVRLTFIIITIFSEINTCNLTKLDDTMNMPFNITKLTFT